MTQHLDRWLLWFVGGALVTAATAWIAFHVQQEGIAPAVLFPLAVGLFLGAMLAALARTLGLTSLGGLVLATLVWGLLVPIGQDYIGHRERLRAYDAELARQSPLAVGAAAGNLRPTFADHVRGKFQAAPGWWTLDAVLTALAAAAVVARGQPRRLTPQLAATRETTI